MHGIKDAALYRKLCEPFPGRKEAAAAMKGFAEELRALREKYKLPDVVALISLNYMDAQGEGTVMFTSNNGDSNKVLPMLAQAYGAELTRQKRLVEGLFAVAQEALDDNFDEPEPQKPETPNV